MCRRVGIHLAASKQALRSKKTTHKWTGAFFYVTHSRKPLACAFIPVKPSRFTAAISIPQCALSVMAFWRRCREMPDYLGFLQWWSSTNRERVVWVKRKYLSSGNCEPRGQKKFKTKQNFAYIAHLHCQNLDSLLRESGSPCPLQCTVSAELNNISFGRECYRQYSTSQQPRSACSRPL